MRDCLNESAENRLTALDWPFKFSPNETYYPEYLDSIALMELFQRTSPQHKKVVSVVIPGGSKVQRTGFGFPGQEKEKKLMIHVAEHGCSGIVLPWSHFFLVLSQSDFFFFSSKSRVIPAN